MQSDTPRVAQPPDLRPAYRLTARGRQEAEDDRLSLTRSMGSPGSGFTDLALLQQPLAHRRMLKKQTDLGDPRKPSLPPSAGCFLRVMRWVSAPGEQRWTMGTPRSTCVGATLITFQVSSRTAAELAL